MFSSEYEIDQCQIHKWYDIFQSITIKSQFINITNLYDNHSNQNLNHENQYNHHFDNKFIQYLYEDSIVLPKVCNYYYYNDELSDDEDLKVIETNEDSLYNFPELDILLNEYLVLFNREVMIKLNWSCPSDAIWINGNTLKCRCISDIYLLLKSSEKVLFDIEHMYDLCNISMENPIKTHNDYDITNTTTTTIATTITTTKTTNTNDNIINLMSRKTSPLEIILVIRKWANLNPSMEFRLFIYSKHIIGISQRDCCTYYDFLDSKVDHLEKLIFIFYNQYICNKFILDNYCIDIYIDQKERIWIIDINPFGEPTCSLLFDWKELLELGKEYNITTHSNNNSNSHSNNNISNDSNHSNDNSSNNNVNKDLIDFRIIESESEVLPSVKGSYRGPIDVHKATDFERFMDICKKDNKHRVDNSSSDSDDG